MPDSEITRFASPDALAEGAARAWLDALDSAAENPISAALSGGRIAARFFEALEHRELAQRLARTPLHYFWGDERCVPPDDNESNFKLARKLLLDVLQVPPERLHRIKGELEPALASSEAETELRQVVPSNAAGQPVLDWLFLGMGEDGHIASLFPGEPVAVRNNPAVFRPVTSPKPPPHRITLGYPSIAAARHIWVLVSGGGKADALRGSLSPESQTPIAWLRRLRPDARILTDVQVEALKRL